MTSTLLINAKDIEQWAERLALRSQLPRLVRRLIQATAPNIERLQFSADEGVQLAGWDGIIEARESNTFVPLGVSAWEMGVDKDIKGKADGDYEKRAKKPLGLNPKETTFAFVTPRQWPKKVEWAQTKRSECIWADVRAYDAHDIETWLEQAPAVHLWFSMLIGKHPQGARSLEDYWADWTAKTDPAFSPALVIGGRQSARERIEAWLRGEAAPLALQGESVDEALAFLSAVIAAQEEQEREELFSRAIIAEDAVSWNGLVLSNARSILVPRFKGEVEGVSRGVRNGNHVFLAGESIGKHGKEALPRIVRDDAEKALEEMDLPHDRARDLATLARRSFPALRRKIACEPTLERPAWAQPQVARELFAPLLVSAWQDPHAADREVLERLSGVSYEQLQETLVRWSMAADPPLRLVGGIWMMAAPEDAWHLLAPFLTADDIQRFKEIALEVLSAPLKSQSFVIEIKGVDTSGEAPCISGTLREGIASTLALMTALSSEVSFVSGGSGEEVARSVVWSLFDKAKGNAIQWASFAPALPLLAEAAPTPFLDAVDAGLKGETPFLRQMFYDEDSHFGFGPTSPHTYLLWALETLIWNPDFFGRTVLCLARLTRIDPGGKNGNRASGSLREIFVVWYPNTTVSLARRLNVLDVVRKHESDVAWRLMLSVLPTLHGDTCQPLHSPKWHYWKPDKERSIPRSEVAEVVEAIVERLLSDVGTSSARWCALIARTGDFWPHLRERLLGKLEALNLDLLTPEERVTMGDVVRSMVIRHREFPDADWVMPEEHLVRLELVGQNLAPYDPVLRHRWRFRRYLHLPEHREMSGEERSAAVSQLRNEALQEIIDAQGWEGVLRLASQVEDPESVGFSLSAMSQSPVDVDVFLAENLASAELWRAAITLGWIRPRAWNNDQEWLTDRMEAAQNVWQPEQWGAFFLPFPVTVSLLKQLEDLDVEAQRYYWSCTQNVALLKECQYAENIIERLLWVGRAAEAICVIHWAIHDMPDLVSPERIMDVLEAALGEASAADLNATNYDSAELFEHLSKTNAPRERLARLEWLYYAIHEHTRTPKVLHDELARDPAFFVEVLSLVCRARPGELETDERESEPPTASEPVNSQEAQVKTALAGRAWSLLWHWHQMPGIREDGTVDEEHLKNWVAKAREIAKERERSVVTLIQIGQALAHSPRDVDGAWPHRAVRDIIEKIANPRLESGFRCQVSNNRGVTSRGLTDGGVQERVLIEQYEKYAAQVADMWPRTASVLRGIAQEYRQLAEHEDRSADLTQDLWK